MPAPARLYTFSCSHFCERARWALDHSRFGYEEVRWAAGIHVMLSRRLKCKGTSVPILHTHEGVFQGSDQILDLAGIDGFDIDVEKRFETRIGPLARRYFYCGVLFAPKSNIRNVILDRVGVVQAAAGYAMWPITKRIMISKMDCHPRHIPHLEDDLEAEFEWLEKRLQGRDYLVGDKFGRTDITAASILAPLVRPKGFPIYRRVRLPKKMEQKIDSWAKRPAMQWVKQMYEFHR